MRGRVSVDSLQFDLEIEKTVRRLRKETQRRKETEQEAVMAEGDNGRANGGGRRTLLDYSTPDANGCGSSILRSPIQANNFELKPALIQLAQQNPFTGGPLEDPHRHISRFIQICDTVKVNGVSTDAVRMRLFPFSLQDKAQDWLQTLPTESLTTWDDLLTKFLAKFFPPQRSAKLRGEINSFLQKEGESLYDAWERFRALLRKCPQHSMAEWLQIQTFYDGLTPSTRAMLDAAAGGNLQFKTPEEAYELIDRMASATCMSSYDRGQRRTVYEIDTMEAIFA